MNSILEEIRRLIRFFTQIETWIGIAIILLILALSFGVTLYAMKFDFINQIYGITSTCRGLTNNIILTLIFMTTGFFISSVLFIGEYINYIDAKQHNDHRKQKISIRNCLFACVTTLAIGLSTIYILLLRC